jgi:dTDP-4-dehydrorhamnose 3,5-epimerase
MSQAVIELCQLGLDGVVELRPLRRDDERGFFSETWRDEWLADIGVDARFVQDNHSYSRSRGVLRGLHFQNPPAAQDKLVRVTRGAIFDVAVDIRQQSPTFGKWAGVILSADEWNQLFVPRGFAHGFVALEDASEVLYKVSAPYSPAFERTIRFDDPAIAIDWPIERSQIILSSKDESAPALADVDNGF